MCAFLFAFVKEGRGWGECGVGGMAGRLQLLLNYLKSYREICGDGWKPSTVTELFEKLQ